MIFILIHLCCVKREKNYMISPYHFYISNLINEKYSEVDRQVSQPFGAESLPSFVDLAYVKILHAEGKHHKLNKYMKFSHPALSKEVNIKRTKISTFMWSNRSKMKIFNFPSLTRRSVWKDFLQTSLEGIPFKLEIKSSFFSVSVMD